MEIYQHFEDLRQIVGDIALGTPVLARVFFVGIFTSTLLLSLPLAMPLMFLAGAIFGFWDGILCSFVATAVAGSLSFFIARKLLYQRLQRRFAAQMLAINQGMQQMGQYYFFSLRLLPLIPFSVLSLVMGLSGLRYRNFLIIGQLGVLPGILLYVWAGTVLGGIESLSELISWRVTALLAVLGLAPLIMRKIMNWRTQKFAKKIPAIAEKTPLKKAA